MLSSRCILFVTNGFTILFGALMASASGCQFELWSEYKYQYRAAAEVKGVALSPGFELTCTVFVRTSQTRCHAQFQVSGCDLKEFDGVRERDVQDSKYLIEELERHPFFVKYPSSTENNSRNSTISQAELYASPSDTVSVLNLKRGIVSALQLPSVPQLHQKQSQKSQLLQTVQNDIFGSCPTELTISSLHDGRLTVETTRDLVVCNLSFVSRIQQSSLSFIKVIVGGAKHAPIAELTYAHESKVTCKYQYLTNVSIMNFESMNCKQTQGLDPGGDFGKRTLAHITQDVKLISKSGTTSDSELDIGKSIKIAWAMDLQQEAESGISDDENDDILYGGKGDAHHVEEVLQKAMYDYLSQGEIQEREHLDRNITSISFRRLVVLMQRMDNLELTLLSATVLSCRDVPLCNMPFKHRASNDVIQAVRQKIFTSSLMTCGSDPCIQVFTDQWLTNDLLSSELEQITVTGNMGLFYTPSSDVAESFLDYCTRKKSWWCWLSFSAMLHRLYDNDPDKSKTKKIIFKSVSSLLGMMASTCEHGKLDALSIPARHSAEGSLAIAVKAIINLGASVQDVHDSNFAHNADGTVLRALLHCVRNSDIKLVIAKDSVKAIKSMGAHQFIVSELLELIRDESKSVVLRAAMFDLLVTQDSFQTLNAALGLIQETQMENLKTYIMTKISAILECQDPAGKSLRATLREVMQEHRFSALGDKILSKSHITHISRYFTVPLTQLELGGWLTLTLIYTPSSSMLHSATLSFGVIANEVKTKVMDISLDFEGMDTLKEVLEKEYLWGSYKTLKSTDLKKILDILQEYIKKVTREKPTRFSYLRRSIWSAIEEITAVVNLKKATFPRMAVSISTLGYEFGFFSSDDILKFWNSKKMEKRMMKNLKHVATSGIETALFHALKVLEDRKVLPTAAGFVLKNIIDVTAIHKTSIEVDSNAFKFLSGKRNDIEAHFLIKPSLSFAVYTDLKVKVPAYSSIGMDASVYGVLQTDLSTDVRLEPPSSADSGTLTLQFSKQVPTKPFNFMHVDADSYTLQNGVKLKIEPSAKPILSELCLPDIYATLTGRRACIKMTKANPSNSYPWNLNDPLQPFMLKGYLTTEDSHLQKYNVDILFQKIPAKRYNFEMLIHAPGTLVSREVKISLNRDNLTRGIQLMCHVPDADLTYTLESKLLSNKTFLHHRFSSILKQAGSCTNSVIFERSSEVLTADSLRSRTSSLTKSVHQSSAMFNITVSGLLSLELQNKYKMTDEGFSNMDVFFTYYCHPRLRLLYSLHPDTLMASNNGHRSKFSFHQEFDSVDLFAENRRGFFNITLQAPGQNLTSVTTIEKTLKGTQRDSDIYWTTLYGKNFLHTTSQVNNLSTAAHFHFNYSLTATKNNEYDVILKGRVLGPWENPIADLDVSADIEYTQRNLEINTKKKRTKRSFSTMMESLGNMEEAIEEKALSLFHTVKQSLLNMFSGSEDDVQGTAKLNTKEDTVRKSKFKDEISHQRPSLWQRPRWSVGLSAKCNISSHIEPTIAKLDVSGPLLGWDIRAIMPKCGTPLFQINGTAFTGKHPLSSITYTKWFRIYMWDQIHHLSLGAWLDHRSNPHEFLHQHNWTLIETDRHSMDRSFLACVHLQSENSFHYNRFISDFELKAPLTNLSHHIDYNRISPTKHKVRVYALLHNIKPSFDMAYIEQTDLIDGSLDTHINLTSSVLDYQLDVCGKSNAGSTSTLDGRLQVDSRFANFPGERTLSTSIVVSRQNPFLCTWIYVDPMGAESNGSVSLLGPKLIGIEAELTNDHRLWWTMELVDLTRIQHTVTFSPAMLSLITALGRKTKHSEAYGPKQAALKPSSNSIENYLMQGLQQAQMSNNVRNVKLYKLSLGMVDAIKAMLLASPPAQIIHALHLDQMMVALPGSTKLTSLSEIKNSPPSIMRQLFKIYGQHSSVWSQHVGEEKGLSEANKKVEEGSQTFVVSAPLPFVLTGFNRPPHMTIVEKEILALIKRFSAGTGRRNKEIALIMQGWNFKTFDGKNIHFAVPRRTSCTYLLGGDLRHSSFVLTYTKSGLSVSTKHSGIILHRDGSVSTTGRHDISLLPYTTEDNMLILESHNGHLHISVDHGKANISFSPHDDVFLVEMDRRLNNVSLGLLGTNNNEMGDDMRLPNGSLAQNSGSFQNSYELTGRGHCKVTTLPPPSMCQRFDISARSPCMSISNQWSQVIPCLLVLDPRPFLWQCQLFECQGKSGCPAVAAYLDTCRHHGIQVDEPPVCDGCRRTGDDVAFDLVIVHSLHWSLVPHHMLDWAVHFIKHLSLIQNSKSKLNIQIGLVTFGGSGEWEGSRSFLMQGNLLQTPRRAYHAIKVNLQSGKTESNATEGILMASNYPLRKDAVRIILLIHDGLSTQTPSSSLLNELKSKDIVMAASAPYDHFSDSGILGQWASRELVVTEHAERPPRDPYSSMVKATGGIWLDWNSLRRSLHSQESKDRVIKEVMSFLQHLAVKAHRQRCQG